MRKIVLALAAIGAIGLALPMAAPAKAEGISIHVGDHHHRLHDRVRVRENVGRHEHWHHRDRVEHRRFERRHHDAVIIKHHAYD